MRDVVRTRLWAATVFAMAGVLLTAAWFFPAFRRSDASVTVGLYIGLPAFAAAVAGWCGGPFLHSPLISGGTAAWRGAVTGVLALVIYAPLFALGIKWSERGATNVAGLAVLTLWFGLVAVGWAVAGMGAAAGWVVWRLARKPRKRGAMAGG